MTFSEYVKFSFSNLGEMKLRVALTAFGVAVGIGALVAMVGFGGGLQENITEGFARLDLFNSITVLPQGETSGFPRRGANVRPRAPSGPATGARALDDKAVGEISRIAGVVTAFPEIRFPAIVKYGDVEEFRLVQVVPAAVSASKIVRLAAGTPFVRDEDDSVIVGQPFLRRVGVKDASAALGRKVIISSLGFDFGAIRSLDVVSMLQGKTLPFKKSDYEFTIVGVTEFNDFSGPSPLSSDIFVPAGSASRIEKLPFTNIWDLFRAGEGRLGYSAVNVRVHSPTEVDKIKARIEEMGFATFALVDQFDQLKTSFVFMDMVLAAIGMIAIFVAALGIVNTMVMSILERYSEIGIMKAVGARRSDIQKIFFVESGAIGLAGGVSGLILGWVVSRLINAVVNYFMARQGLPFVEYFHFPFWLCLGAILFAVGVSLVAGIYPAMRAASVDPVVALRHE